MTVEGEQIIRAGNGDRGLRAEIAVGELRRLASEVVSDEKDRLFWRQLFEVGDEADARAVEEMRRIGDYWEQQLLNHPEWQPPTPDPHRPGHLVIPPENQAAQWLYRLWDSKDDRGSMRAWAATLFPTARALYPLQRLEDGGRVLPGGVIDDRARYLFETMVDGLGLRSRARIYAHELEAVAGRFDDERLRIVSLGCGAAVPNIDATLQIEQRLGRAIDWDLYDSDVSSLQFAQGLVAEAGEMRSTFAFGLRQEGGNQALAGRHYGRAFGLSEESVQVVDALGLWEYLPRPANFAKKAYALLKPGGSLIVSNMLPGRPQREFNQRAVGWPGLYLRSESELLDILEEATIDSRHVTMTHATDGVYVVMEIRKP